MDENDNILDYQKMNFAQFPSQFTNVNQFTPSKYAQNITTSNGQVVGLVSGSGGDVQYIRAIDSNGTFTSQNNCLNPIMGQIHQNLDQQQDQQQQHQQHQQQQHQTPQSHQALITLPITVPGAKIGDAQQTVHIQVINPNPMPHQPQQQKYQMGQMQIPIQSFQPGGTTVLTVAYSPQDGKFLQNHGFPEGMTVVAAIQPQDLQLLAQAQVAQQMVSNNLIQQQQQQQQQQHQQQQQQQQSVLEQHHDEKQDQMECDEITIKEEPIDWEAAANLGQNSQPDLSEYITTHSQLSNIPMTLTPYLKFNPESIKYEEPDFTTDDTNNTAINPTQSISVDQKATEIITEDNLSSSLDTNEPDGNGKTKRKRRVKKPKLPKPKPPKPGQVLIATTIDGTVLFCCPECQMAYPEKENLEQHLTVHKIERRYICDICGAGLKRKEHLERHKSGHNPDRPFICSVCMKGFKRKEHLNLHFVIHSGEKNEICGECGKGFYRKDHLRKHTNSHIAKRMKEEMNARDGITPKQTKKSKNQNNNNNNNNINTNNNNNNTNNNNNNITNNNSDTSNNNSLNSSLNSNTSLNNNSTLSTTQTIDNNILIHPQIANSASHQLQEVVQQNLINNQHSSSNGDNTLNTNNNNAISINMNNNIATTNNSGSVVTNTQPAISLSTVYVPTSDNTTLPVQIQIPQIITTSSPDGTTTSTIVMPQQTESPSQQTLMTTST